MTDEHFRPPSLEEAIELAEMLAAEANRLQGSIIALHSVDASFGEARANTVRMVKRLERDAARMQRAAEILTWLARRANRLHELNRPRLQPVPSSARR